MCISASNPGLCCTQQSKYDFNKVRPTEDEQWVPNTRDRYNRSMKLFCALLQHYIKAGWILSEPVEDAEKQQDRASLFTIHDEDTVVLPRKNRETHQLLDGWFPASSLNVNIKEPQQLDYNKVLVLILMIWSKALAPIGFTCHKNWIMVRVRSRWTPYVSW